MLSVQGRVGRYELVKLLALSHGTTGMVCLAVDARTRQRVVVKLISRRSADDVEGLIAAERRGAVLQDRLSRRSDAVPAVYECGDDDGVFYVAMEHVEGEDLERQIGTGLRLPADTAAQIVRDVCGCLAVAHTPQHLVDGSVRLAIVHADVKPANIRVTPSGRAEAD